MSAAPLPTMPLPGISWTEDSHVKTPSETSRALRRYGTVENARAILDHCSREVIYDLIALGCIKAYKLRPHSKNSPWHVDLLSCWEHKQRQMCFLGEGGG